MITNIFTQNQGEQQPSAVTTIVKCDSPECTTTVSFDQINKVEVMKEHTWLRNYRTVQTADGRPIGYCSDACELKGITSGKHNIPEPAKVAAAGTAAEVAAAVNMAKARSEADAAIRAGKPANIQITDK